MAGSLQRPAVTGPGVVAVYALGSSGGESARLRRQADELAADSAALLDRVGLRPGQAAIDLGCGPRGILDLLRSMRAQILQMGLASEPELDGLDAAARGHLEDPRTVVISGFVFLAWGRKPVGSAA